MGDKIEFTVSHATASLDGDTARISLVTDRGNVTLQMHRLDLGALGGTIARALWPKAGESLPTQPQMHEAQAEVLTDAAPLTVPTQPDLHEVEAQPSAAIADPDAGIIPTQPQLHEPAEPSAVIADPEPHSIPTQPELHEADAPEASAEADRS